MEKYLPMGSKINSVFLLLHWQTLFLVFSIMSLTTRQENVSRCKDVKIFLLENNHGLNEHLDIFF